MNAYIAYCVMCLLIQPLTTRVIEDHTKQRNRILQDEYNMSLGAKLVLNEDEKKVNEILMKLKNKEVDESFRDPAKFLFSKHYFFYRKNIAESKVYEIIRKMPKGAILHVHSSYILGADDLIELTYEDHLYACYNKNEFKLQFSTSVPKDPCQDSWSLLSDLRGNASSVEQFDSEIKQYLSLVSEDPASVEANINDIWNNFETIHKSIRSLIGYRPVREKYMYKSLQRLYEDNIMYAEIRTGLGHLFELDGTVHDKLYMAKLYRKITDKFIEDHPNFIGIKIIVAVRRSSSSDKIRQDIELTKACKAEMPDLCVGFDLVGQEDLGKPLLDFEPELNKVKSELGFYFHGGETNWFGTTTDENLVDAVLIGSKRIGHAYSLIKHPSLMSLVKKKDIAIEVNLISNVVLALVRDVRNHPLASYLAFDLPVVLSSDDPGAWSADPLSHDYYVTFVGVASKKYDLRLLKQLAINSIKYSAMNNSEKTKCFKIFNDQWRKFIEDILSGNVF